MYRLLLGISLITLIVATFTLCGCFLGTNKAKYCGNCGAKMDLEDKQ